MKSDEAGQENDRAWDVVLEQSETRITVVRYPDRPGSAANLFGALATACIITDVVIETPGPPGTIRLLVVTPEEDQVRCRETLLYVVTELAGGEVGLPEPVARLSIIGPDATTDDDVAEKVLTTLAGVKIDAVRIHTASNFFAVIVDRERGHESVGLIRRALAGYEVGD